jgi:hypothetical protein
VQRIRDSIDRRWRAGEIGEERYRALRLWAATLREPILALDPIDAQQPPVTQVQGHEGPGSHSTEESQADGPASPALRLAWVPCEEAARVCDDVEQRWRAGLLPSEAHFRALWQWARHLPHPGAAVARYMDATQGRSQAPAQTRSGNRGRPRKERSRLNDRAHGISNGDGDGDSSGSAFDCTPSEAERKHTRKRAQKPKREKKTKTKTKTKRAKTETPDPRRSRKRKKAICSSARQKPKRRRTGLTAATASAAAPASEPPSVATVAGDVRDDQENAAPAATMSPRGTATPAIKGVAPIVHEWLVKRTQI